MIKFSDSLMKRLGLVPMKELQNAYNPNGIADAYAKADNIYAIPYVEDSHGNLMRPGQGFSAGPGGAYYTGYDVPTLALLQQAFGTTQLQGQQITGKARWSEVTYVDNSTTTLSPFSTTQTGVAGNQEQGGVMPDQLHFIIRAIKINVEVGASFQTSAAVVAAFNDIFLLVNNATYRLKVIRKDYVEIPLYLLPAGVGISGNMAAAGGEAANETWGYATHGVPDPRAVWVLTNPLLMLERTNFAVTLTWEAAQDISGNTVIAVIHDGQEIAPVQ